MKSRYAQILVHLDGAAQAGVRLALARRLGQQQGARVTALYSVTPGLVQMPFAGGVGPDFAAHLAAIDAERRAQARARFDAALQEGGAPVQWAERCEPPVIGSFAQQALHADLLVLGQSHPEQLADLPADFPQAVLAASGKPALIVPHIAAAGPLGESIVIAWKPTREAARAVAAAMPLLQRARAVHILAWGEPEPAPGPGGLDLGSYLQAHGVDAIRHDNGPEPDAVGEELLSRSFDLGADLLVMGCYGHSRAREWLLGGASRTLLGSMTLPVLMSH